MYSFEVWFDWRFVPLQNDLWTLRTKDLFIIPKFLFVVYK